MMKKILVLAIAAVMLLSGTVFACNESNNYLNCETTYCGEYTVAVADDYLYLRTGPGAEYMNLQTLYRNTVLTIYETVINRYDGRPWGLTTYNGKTGWISLNWTTANMSYSTPSYYPSYNGYNAVNLSYNVYVNDSYLYLRTGPGTEYRSQYTIYRNQRLTITSTVINPYDGRPWGYTTYNGVGGWVSLNWTARY